MTSSPAQSEETQIAKRRKAQVLDAAAECFRRYGFHRSSMAKISAAAGMSSGHIYHYFKNKEDIVVAIAEREKGVLESILLDELKEAKSPEEAKSILINQATKGADLQKEMSRAALLLEVVAEASRNPEIGSVIHRLDKETHESFISALGDSSPENISRLEILAALMEGLSVRVFRNPNVDRDLDPEMLQSVIRYLFSLPSKQ